MSSLKAKPSSLGTDDSLGEQGMNITTAISSTNASHAAAANLRTNPPYKRVSTDVETPPTEQEEEHESDCLLNDDDEHEVSRQRRKKFSSDSADHTCFFLGSWLCLILLLAIFILGLNIWRKQQHHVEMSHRQKETEHKPIHKSIHHSNDDAGDDDDDVTGHQKGTFYFDPDAVIHHSDLLDLASDSVSDFYANTLVPPIWNPLHDSALESNGTATDNDADRLGYIMQPSSVNGTVAFVSEGDLYWASWQGLTPDVGSSRPAMKLTTTVGNVRTPKINPKYPYWIAYTATYTARRDVYLIDLRRRARGNQPALRLTYWPDSSGVRGIVGWKDDGKTLVIEAFSNTVSLPDVRMYELTLAITPQGTRNMGQDDDDNTKNNHMVIKHPQVLQLNPVPLAQAVNGAYHEHESCWYFTRFQQSSNTARYQGGTAENIWAWCQGHELAVALTMHQFNGTSKEPSLFGLEAADGTHADYMLFLSDRGTNSDPNDSNQWVATTMELWAILLPRKDDLTSVANINTNTDKTTVPSYNRSQFIQLTQVACEFQGMPLREYSLDPITQDVVLRIGADLFWMSAETIADKLRNPSLRQLEQTNATNSARIISPTLAPTRGAKQNHQASKELNNLGILVYSDFHEHQERIIPLSFPECLGDGDIYETVFGQTSFLMTVRGQVWVAPVAEDKGMLETTYGAGRNLPLRRYRVAPGSKMGGAIRVLSARHVPVLMQDRKSNRRLAVLLATDPRSLTAEHAFYLIETQSDALPSFVSMDYLPDPFVGGHKSGGSTRNGGLGSVVDNSVRVSPCGRRLAWVDTDGRICVMNLPIYKEKAEEYDDYTVLPAKNELGEPLLGVEAMLSWSPGGRYLAIEHNARNQFSVITIADCGDPLMPTRTAQGDESDSKMAEIKIGRIVQVTPDRFNSFSLYWGKSNYDRYYYTESKNLAEAYDDEPETEPATTTLYFLTDRDVYNDASSPWGTRAPNPHFKKYTMVYALPLFATEHKHNPYSGHFSGGGAEELFVDKMLYIKSKSADKRRMTALPSPSPTVGSAETHFPFDPSIDFGMPDLSFARRAYRLANIPIATYTTIVCQAQDDSSLLLLEKTDDGHVLKIALTIDFPSDKIEMKDAPKKVLDFGLSTKRDHVYLVFGDTVKIIKNTAAGITSLELDKDIENDIAFTSGMAVSVWPSLEYQQMYADAWRMMRDYFYDREMTGINWYEMFGRYLPLVKRCAKREELDDVLIYMASEVSALHVFVYGGEYSTPFGSDERSLLSNTPATLAVSVERSAEWKGYVITSLPELDPDFSIMDREELYSPLSERTLRLSGQRGLKVGDVIVAINGESVMHVPDIGMLLRGMKHQSVRLDILRLASSEVPKGGPENVKAEPVIAVPVDPNNDLFYPAWEWQTRQQAKKLAADAGFSVGYVHLRSMSSPEDEDAFARGYFPDYDKDALIVDVRHNRGGNIDWWLLDVLQRRAWMYWEGRASNASNGGLGWDEQFAFRGHIVVLINEKTASDGEAFSRGVSELGLGRLIGMRTWGGGIWLASDNRLVDGGVATAPEDGTYNENLGPGVGIEQQGVQPDIVVDNNPRTVYEGRDTQLETAIAVLKEWLREEPVVLPKAPAKKRDMSYDYSESCVAS